MTTVQQIRRLSNRVEQIIVLSHSKSFLGSLWDSANLRILSAIRLVRDAVGSTLEAWDVRQDSITEHDRRHALVVEYISASDPSKEREVAISLRHMLESYMRVAYPMIFPPGSLLGNFNNTCRSKLNTPDEILKQSDIDELQDLLDYANSFHHSGQPAWHPPTINDQMLCSFCERTLKFTQRS